MSSFFKTEAGHLTLAFIVIVIGACLIRAGLASGAVALLGVGAAAVGEKIKIVFHHSTSKESSIFSTAGRSLRQETPAGNLCRP